MRTIRKNVRKTLITPDAQTHSGHTYEQCRVPLSGCTKYTQCSWTRCLCGVKEPPHPLQSTQAGSSESNNFSFSRWKGLRFSSVILSVQWSLPFLPPHTTLSKDMHLRRGSAGSSASYLDGQCHIKTLLSSNYIVCWRVAEEIQPYCNLVLNRDTTSEGRKNKRQMWDINQLKLVECCWSHPLSMPSCECECVFFVSVSGLFFCFLLRLSSSLLLCASFSPSHSFLSWTKAIAVLGKSLSADHHKDNTDQRFKREVKYEFLSHFMYIFKRWYHWF